MSDTTTIALLAAKLARGFNLTGSFYEDHGYIVLEDGDKNPTILIDPEKKRVTVKHEGNIREIILAGCKQYANDAGLEFFEAQVEPEVPSAIKRLAEAIHGPSEEKPKKKVH